MLHTCIFGGLFVNLLKIEQPQIMADEIKNGDAAKVSPLFQYTGVIIYLATGIADYWFWAVPYRAALSYREQMQLFQTTWRYFTDSLSRPAGVATYIGEFLTQFFNNYWVGAAILTALLLLFLFLCNCINCRFASQPISESSRQGLAAAFCKRSCTWMYSCLALAFVPLSGLWLFLGNANLNMSFIIAIISSLAAASGFKSRSSGWLRYLWMLVGTTLLYWWMGPTAIVFTLLILASIWKDNTNAVVSNTIFSIIALVWLSVNFYLWSLIITYPVSYQLIGIGYILNPDALDKWQLIVETLCVIVPITGFFLAKVSQKIVVPVVAVLVIAGVVILYPKAYDKLIYRIMEYDYLVRTNDWLGILEYSDEHNPEIPISVCATNLALGMTGQLDSRAFDYYQHTAEGLFPPFVKETLSSWTGGEVAFQLGMINTAQRFYFEGMEAIPNYNKSVRAIKRLAETAMIRGDYQIARKYLGLLENTIIYKNWAKKNLELIKDPNGVDKHPVYGQLRARMIDEEYMFSEGELDKTFGQLFMKDPRNDLAKQYLVVYPLLQRDLNKFIQYMGVVAEDLPNYNPLLAQQAMAFISMKNGQPIPRQIVPEHVEQSLRNFATAWTSKDPARIEPYKRTLYHYLISND